MLCSSSGDTNFFDIVTRVLQGNIFPSLLMICLDYVLQTSTDQIKEDGSRQYPAEAITDADYTDDLVLLTNTPAQVKSLLHNLEQPARGIDLYVNANKTKLMCFKQEAISTLNDKPLKLADQFASVAVSHLLKARKDMDYY